MQQSLDTCRGDCAGVVRSALLPPISSLADVPSIFVWQYVMPVLHEDAQNPNAAG